MKNILTEMVLAVGHSMELSIVVKATVLVTLALVGTRLARWTRASVRHVVLASAFGVLLALPIAATLIPQLAIDIPMSPAPVLSGLSSVGQNTDAGYASVPTEAVFLTSGRRTSTAVFLRIGWAASATLFLVPLVLSLSRLRQIRLHGRPWPKGYALLRRLAIEADIRASVDLFLHDDIVAPMTCGLVRPAIVLPSDAREWSNADLQCAVVHELEHVRRGDWSVHLMARVVCALYWFHPLVWTAWRRLRLESERACDDAVLRGGDRTAYADQLVMLARRLSKSAARPVLSMASRSDLSVRVSAVLDSDQSRGRVGTMASMMTISAAVLLLLGIAPLGAVGHSATNAVPMASNSTAPLPVATISVSAPPAQSPVVLSGSKSESMKPKTAPKVLRSRAQSGAPDSRDPAFAATTVRANKSGDAKVYPLTMGPDGRFAVTNVPLRALIGVAYQGYRMEDWTGNWLDFDRFDIEAKAEGNPSREQMWLMVRKLLADRFYLIAHTEVRVLPGYAVVLAKTDGSFGPRLRPSACIAKDTAPFPPGPFDLKQPPPLPCGASRGRPTGNMEARWQTMEEVARGLFTPMFGRKVSDQTGLAGKFDFEVEWTPAPGPPGPAALGVGPATFTAIEEQLGLRLDPQIGPVDYLVIDRVERPTEDQ